MAIAIGMTMIMAAIDMFGVMTGGGLIGIGIGVGAIGGMAGTETGRENEFESGIATTAI